MNAPATVQQGPSRALTPIKEFQQQVESRADSFASTLPAHIPIERFMRVVLRAVQKDPGLLNADRASLMTAAMDAANDGLLPDGQQAAFVVFNTKAGKKVQYMPMVFGILKKVRNSGELKSISARLVYGGDSFRYWIDENGEHITYEAADTPDKSIFRRAFAIAITKDDGRYIEVMDADDVDKVRNVSKAKANGPWTDWWEEMVKKTVIRRLSKRLPMSTDLDDLMRRDDALYNFEDAKARHTVEAPRMLSDRLDALADARPYEQGPDGSEVGVDPNPSATIEHESQSEPAGSSPDGSEGGDGDEAPPPASSRPADQPPPDQVERSGGGDPDESPEQRARRLGVEARAKGMSRKAIPKEFQGAGSEVLKTAYLDGFDTGEIEDREPGMEG